MANRPVLFCQERKRMGVLIHKTYVHILVGVCKITPAMVINGLLTLHLYNAETDQYAEAPPAQAVFHRGDTYKYDYSP